MVKLARRLQLCLLVALFTVLQTSEGFSQSIRDSLSSIPLQSIHVGDHLGQKIDACIVNRILSQDVEMLVAPFRKREETNQWQMEFWGKWMLSATAAYRYTSNSELKQKIDLAARELIKTQTADGYIGNYRNDAHLKEWDIWGRKYVLLGLLSYHDLTHDNTSLKAARKVAEHLISEAGPGHASIATMGNYRGMASCSVLEPVMILYDRTQDARYLNFAKYIVEQWEKTDGPKLISKALDGIPVSDRFPKPTVWWGYENGQKAYEMMSCYDGLLLLYKVTGKKEYLEAVTKTANNIIADEINIAGSGCSFECWYHGSKNQIIPTNNTMETCVTQTWMKLCLNLLRLTGNPVYAAQIEKTSYNALLASMTPDATTFTKYSPLEGVRSLGDGQCGMNINCCIANGPRGFLLVPEYAVMSSSETVYVNSYNTLDATLTLGNKVVVQVNNSTTYPVSDSAMLTVNSSKAAFFTIALRIPEWSTVTKIAVNGVAVSDVTNGSYKRISRTWSSNDKITVRFTMEGNVVRKANLFSITRGPVVLCRDSRLGSPFIDDAINFPKDNNHVALTMKKDLPGNVWMAFDASVLLGTNLENNPGPQVISFCDYSSGGNTWDNSSRFRVWLRRIVNVMDEPITTVHP